MRQDQKIRAVIDRVLWTAGATAANRALLTSAICDALVTPSPANGAVGEMPELPEPFGHIEVEDSEGWCKDILDGWTADQVFAYARAAVLAERSAIANGYERQANEYINDHADYEPETGAVVWEFGDAGRDYHSMLLELAESVRART